MLAPDQQSAVSAAQASAAKGDMPNDLIVALRWQPGWDWSQYGPLVTWLVKQPAPLLAANLDRGEIMKIYRTKPQLQGCAQAGFLIVSARSGGSQADTDGISLFLVPVEAPGVSVRDYRTIDGQRAATVTLVQVVLGHDALVGQAGQGWPVLDAALDYGAALLCAEAVGAMDAIFAATLDYLKTRQQFGAPIGKFQALQHRMADMFIHLEQARSMAMLAAAKVDSTDVAERRRTVSAAKARVGLAATFVGQQAVQLHGGMGVTDELPAAHHFKRLSMIALTLSDVEHHIERFIAQPGFLPTETA